MDQGEGHKIIMYRFTGRQGFFTIPEKWCAECDLLLALLNDIIAVNDLAGSVKLTVRPWWLWWFVPLVRYGSWHAPQLIIYGKLISAGIVPDRESVERALGIVG